MSSHACVLMPPCWIPPPEPLGSLDFCPMLTWFQVCAIMQTQLTTLSQAGVWGEVKKPRQDMTFLMIVPSTTARGDQLFSLAVLWVYLCQGHLSTLVKAAQKLMLLADNSPDWLYAFVHMSDTILHVPLSNNGHIGTMADGICSVSACGWFHQIQVWKLLQHSDSIVFPEGLNGEAKALQFYFWELPLWNATSADGATQDLPMIEVVLSGTESKTASPTQVPPLLLAIKPLHDIAMVLNLHLPGALEWPQWTSPAASAPTSQHSMPGRKLLSAALGAPPSTRTEDPLSLEGTDSAIPDPMATSSQASLGEVMLEHIANIVQVGHSPSLPTILKTPDVASISPSPQSQAPQRPIQPACLMRCFDCKMR